MSSEADTGEDEFLFRNTVKGMANHVTERSINWHITEQITWRNLQRTTVDIILPGLACSMLHSSPLLSIWLPKSGFPSAQVRG